jgi:hypothetical protein
MNSLSRRESLLHRKSIRKKFTQRTRRKCNAPSPPRAALLLHSHAEGEICAAFCGGGSSHWLSGDSTFTFPPRLRRESLPHPLSANEGHITKSNFSTSSRSRVVAAGNKPRCMREPRNSPFGHNYIFQFVIWRNYFDLLCSSTLCLEIHILNIRILNTRPYLWSPWNFEIFEMFPTFKKSISTRIPFFGFPKFEVGLNNSENTQKVDL